MLVFWVCSSLAHLDDALLRDHVCDAEDLGFRADHVLNRGHALELRTALANGSNSNAVALDEPGLNGDVSSHR